MKTLKIIIISLVVISVFTLAFYKEDTVNIEGTWIPEKIILNDKILFPTKIFTDYLDEFRASVARLLKGFMDRKIIIEADPLFLANEFILSLTYSQFEFIILNKGPKDLKGMREYYTRHVDFFWESVRAK